MNNSDRLHCALPEHVIKMARGEVAPPAPGGCYIKPLPQRLQDKAAQTAAEVYPLNIPKPHSRLDHLLDPFGAAGTRFWGPQPRTLTVGFLDDSNEDLQHAIVHHMNAWDCNITFALATSGPTTADLRITLADQASTWSYLGTEALLVPNSKPTMALPGVSIDMPQGELKRRVIHVAGHALGFQHKSLASKAVIQDIIPEKAYIWFRETQSWTPSTVDNLLLQPPSTPSAAGGNTEACVMEFWLPAEIMCSQTEAKGASDITAADLTMCRSIYQAKNT